MNERPILFSDPMVRAILSGEKTQTRRVVKPEIALHMPAGANCGSKQPFRCPYGQPGDRLWVREHWYQRGQWIPLSGPEGVDWEDATWKGSNEIVHAAGGQEPENDPNKRIWWRSRPSIHMPRWACRLVLEIVSVRVERLQDISRGDCMEEGCPFPNMAKETDPVGWFRDLWSGINGAVSWAANPWVWVVEFRRVQP